MERLSPSDLDRVLRFVREISEVDRLSEFPVRLLDGLRQLIACDLVGYNEIDPDRGTAVMVLRPSADASILEGQTAFARHAGQHPVLQYHARTGDGKALKISDFMSRDQFHRTDLYAESFRLIAAEDQLAVALPSASPLVIGIALNRSRRGFSERDRQVLDLIRPHLAYAHRNAELRSQLGEMVILLERLVDDTDRAVVLIDQSRRVRLASRRAATLFADYTGERAVSGAMLPEVIEGWVARGGMVEFVDNGHPPLILDGERGRLMARFLPHGEIGEYDAILLEEVSADSPAPLGRLSSREREVLGWVARGKTNPQIADILSLSPGTIQKHLEHIYDKLGVRTRAAAAVALAGRPSARA